MHLESIISFLKSKLNGEEILNYAFVNSSSSIIIYSPRFLHSKLFFIDYLEGPDLFTSRYSKS